MLMIFYRILFIQYARKFYILTAALSSISLF